MKTKYVLGFLFSDSLQDVALIEKSKPSWQIGLLNGVGGKVEKGESPLEAMQREFREEAGVNVGDWKLFATMSGNDYLVICYASKSTVALTMRSTQTEESVTIVSVCDHEPKRVPNLSWLIPMAMESLNGSNINAEIKY